MTDGKDHVKLVFELANGEVESMWAKEEGDNYKLDNIPFYAIGVAVDDVLSASRNADGELVYSGLVTPSGHSTVRILFSSAGDVQRIRDELAALGCQSERSELSRLIAVDIPPEVPYSTLQKWLDDGEKAGTFEYEEGCLGQGR